MRKKMPKDNTKEAGVAPKGKIRITGRAVVTPPGAITGAHAEDLKKRLNAAIDQHKTEIILDLKKVSLIDSKGLEALVDIHDRLFALGGALKLVDVNAICWDIFIATRLVNTFKVYNDFQEAIKS